MVRWDVRMGAAAAALASVFAVATAGATLAEDGPWDHADTGGWDDAPHVGVTVAGWPGGMTWDHDDGRDDSSHHEGDWHGGESHHGGHDDHGHDD